MTHCATRLLHDETLLCLDLLLVVMACTHTFQDVESLEDGTFVGTVVRCRELGDEKWWVVRYKGGDEEERGTRP